VIINTSIITNTFPDLWKISHVVPLYKSNDADDVNNYRPISLLPIFSKILEKIVAKQLMSYLEHYKLLSDAQHGFRSGLSTESALLKVTEKIYKNMDNRKISLLILFDLSKAFDSVNHSILLNKCKNLNVHPIWLRSYLSNRSQSVRVGNTISSPQNVNFGVPQGSVLGPILFSVYVNDFSQCVSECLVIQYADDTQLLLTEDVDNIAQVIARAEFFYLQLEHIFKIMVYS